MKTNIINKQTQKNIKLKILPILLLLFACIITGCGRGKSSNEKVSFDETVASVTNATDIDAISTDTSGVTAGNESGDASDTEIEVLYATEFKIDNYKGLRLLTIGEDRFLIVPEGVSCPDDIDKDITVIKQNLENVYLVSSSAMDLICAIDAEKSIRLTGTKKEDWYIEKAATAMENGDMLYAGKYSTPDYELILGNGCDLAIENTMIYHNPETKEKLEELGIPVMVERSSYEADPRGRLEWIKVYGVLFGKEQEAVEYFDSLMEPLDKILEEENTGKTVAYFYITGNGAVNVRKSKDYISKLIEMAGGKYIFDSLGEEEDNALSTVNMQVEEFYAAAKDADILIYNSTIVGELENISDMISLCPVLEDFKAVKEGNVYCTSNNFFQRTCSMSEFAVEINSILKGTAPDSMEFLYLLK